MGEIINLRRERKRVDRLRAEAAAAVNRQTHGLSKAERELSAARRTKADQELDRHRIDRGDER